MSDHVKTAYSGGGGDSCAVVGCTNNRKKLFQWKSSVCDIHGSLHHDCACCVPYKLHTLPEVEEIRLKWLSALRRKDPPKNIYVCSLHFIDGQPSSRNPVPSINLGYDAPVKEGRRILKRKLFDVDSTANTGGRRKANPDVHIDKENVMHIDMDSSTCESTSQSPSVDCGSQTDVEVFHSNSVATQWTDISLQDHEYDETVRISCSKEKTTQTNAKYFEEKGVNCNTTNILMTYDDITSDTKSLLYTGLTLIAFQTLVQVMEQCDQPFKFMMPIPDQILLTLMKVKLNLLFADIGFRFGISESHASNIFNNWLPFLAEKLRDLVHWLPRETLRAAMPASFQEKYPRTTVIIDCAETFMQRPKNLKTRGETYSHYKSNNTVKYLVGISPHGQIMFISKGFGGRASDKFIVENSGFLNYLLPGDEIMADRGFTINDLLFPLRVKLNIPAFTKGKDQLSEKDVTQTRRIAHVRIHVERAIRRLKVFKILSDIVPVSLVKKIDDILIVCSALVNLGPELIRESNVDLDDQT